MSEQSNAPLFAAGPAWEEVASELAHSRDTQRMLAVLAYRLRYEREPTTDTATIIAYYRRARWHRPTNLSATANYCAGKGWITKVGENGRRKLWQITRKGYDLAK